ncbi:hypothetical protein E4U38_008271 [Claviceps purpurea]|nr:hypothetical protein E4U38_008271 [Claviceps purpurea]KAG6150701.1 hypothetical protein E4U11_008220 [Claviceps purpurea]KAG6170598.1 hypothetical protein E4U27_007330 [Claviceps purpurea]KAG6178808.1 hypothetical protein E4U10_008068 [Claviceps purpurea]KAG6217783.1 hypothetical protein E4U26_007785 [Claviceps purpurea]
MISIHTCLISSFKRIVHLTRSYYNTALRLSLLHDYQNGVSFPHLLIDAKNKVPEQQRYYQQAYKAHTRIWMIGSRSRWYMTPYLVMLWGGFGAALYAAGRKVTGHNTWFGKN